MRWTPLILSLFLLGCPTTGGSDDDDSAAGSPLDSVTSTDRPGKRSEILGVADAPSDSIVIFGGNQGPVVAQIPYAEYTGETWVFEPRVGWTEVQGDGPSERGRYAVGYDPSGRMLMFGGRWRQPETSGNYTLFDDLWSFDFASRTWQELDAGDDGPSGRYYPGGVWSTTDDAFYVWGGATNPNALAINPNAELWRWTDQDGWEQRPTSGDAPSTRVFFGSTYDPPRNRMVVFAGQIGDFQSLAYNDVYALDLGTGEWSQLQDGTGNAPSTRMHPHLLYRPEDDAYLMWGGHTDVGDANDLWSFDPNSETWTLVYQGDTFTGVSVGCASNPSEVPADYVVQDLSAPERRHRAMLAELDGSLWLFGGMHAECSDHLDDTWRYDLTSNTWHQILEARSGESCLRRADDCECLCL